MQRDDRRCLDTTHAGLHHGLVDRESETSAVGRRRSSWASTAIVLGTVAAVILLLGYARFQAPY